MYTILVVILILAIFGALPAYPYSVSWGWGPSGILGLLLLIVLIILVLGRV